MSFIENKYFYKERRRGKKKKKRSCILLYLYRYLFNILMIQLTFFFIIYSEN